MMRAGVAFVALLAAGSVYAQESQFAGDWRRERESLKSCADLSKVVGCGQTLFTGHPFHIAVGSLAPGNGVAAGLAVVGHWNTDNWRNNYSADGVGSSNGSWRAGLFVNFVHVRRPGITVGMGGVGGSGAADAALREQTVVSLYSETTSLQKVELFNRAAGGRTFFSFRETITGGRVAYPVARLAWLNASLLGEANSRVPEARLDNGLRAESPAYAQFGQGVRLRPSARWLRLNYLARVQEFAAFSGKSTFQRLTFDLNHTIPLYRNSRAAVGEANTPNSCLAGGAGSEPECPKVQFGTSGSRNLEGSFGVRLLIQESMTSGGNTVPFYFQPTLGGSDVNGETTLGSYPDYRFRAPNVLLLRTSFEHSIWGPLGVLMMFDQGKAVARRGDIDFSGLRHSWTAGLTLRAGGLPLVRLMFSWGGKEGTHTTAAVDTSLLGGGARPSLY
ncbi:MAG: hypothetical protein JWN34_5575 [Bryobacterales bacterium]|nr:hypothetical protein [Bryobacterales bacterium]